MSNRHFFRPGSALTLWIVLCLCALSSVSRATTDKRIDLRQDDVTRLTHQIRYLEDAGGRQTIDQIRQHTDQDWRQNGDRTFNQGYNDSVWWLHLQVANDHPQPHKAYLELSYAVLDYVDIYVYEGHFALQEYHTGDKRPFTSRPVDSASFVIPLQAKPGQALDIYYRIESATSIQAPLSLWQSDAFFSRDAYANILQGFYFGAMVILVVYNLLIFFILRERSYFYYVGFIMSMPLFFLAIGGQGYRYVWTDSIEWNSVALPLFLSSTVLFGSLFTRRFLTLNTLSTPVDLMIKTFAILGFVSVMLSFMLPYHIIIKALVPIGLFACIADLTAGCLAWYRKVPSARYYLVAWASFLFGSIIFALSKVALIPTNFFTEYAIQIGSILEAVLLSFALANRINVERRLRFEAQEASLSTTQRLNEQLEQRVQERTMELEMLNKQLKVLSNTDELTGLRNRRYMTTAIEEEWSRSKRYEHPLTVMLLDIDHFKHVNDDYGHQSGDQCLQQVARLIRESVRFPCDMVSRYGGEEFCVMLPETEGQGAMAVAERIRSTIEKHPVMTDQHPFSVTVSIGLYHCVPTDLIKPDTMLRWADTALYQSKERGRNRVTVFDCGKEQGDTTVKVTLLRK